MKRRITHKVKEACLILCDNPISDIGEGVIEEYIQAGKVSINQVYSLMKKFGYVWNERKKYWNRPIPAWLQKIEDHELDKWSASQE